MIDLIMHQVDSKRFPTIEVSMGQIVFKEGQPGSYAYIVRSGSIGIFQIIDTRKIQLTTVRKGEVFGEMAIMTGQQRTATAEALEFSQLLLISGQNFQAALQEALPLVKTLMTQLLNRLIEKEKKAAEFLASQRDHQLVKSYENTLQAIDSHMTDYVKKHGDTIKDEARDFLLSLASQCRMDNG